MAFQDAKGGKMLQSGYGVCAYLTCLKTQRISCSAAVRCALESSVAGPLVCLALAICRRLRGRVSEDELARLSTKPYNATLALTLGLFSDSATGRQDVRAGWRVPCICLQNWGN